MPEQRDLYKILQVDSEADPDVIQAAYRRLAQKYHPDLAGSHEASGRMIELNAAWEVLRDPHRRGAYDRERARTMGHQTGDQPGAAPSPRPAAPTPGTPTDVGGSSGAAGAGAGAAGRPAASGGWPDAAATPGNGRPGEPSSGHWTSGRSSVGGGYDPSTMHAPDGYGAAGRPPGNPSGSVLNFGRYAGWSLGEVGRRDVEYLEWLERSPIGRQYRDEVDAILRRLGRRRAGGDDGDRRGLFRR